MKEKREKEGGERENRKSWNIVSIPFVPFDSSSGFRINRLNITVSNERMFSLQGQGEMEEREREGKMVEKERGMGREEKKIEKLGGIKPEASNEFEIQRERERERESRKRERESRKKWTVMRRDDSVSLATYLYVSQQRDLTDRKFISLPLSLFQHSFSFSSLSVFFLSPLFQYSSLSLHRFPSKKFSLSPSAEEERKRENEGERERE